MPFDIVREHHYQALFEAWAMALERGHRRIGAVLPSLAGSLQNQELEGATAYHQVRVPEVLPSLILCPRPEDGSRAHYEATTVEWYERHRPTLVIGKNMTVLHWLLARGHRCPEDFSFIALRCVPAELGAAGFEVDTATIARLMVERMDAMVRTGRRGPAPAPTITLVPSRWRDGPTLRARAP